MKITRLEIKDFQQFKDFELDLTYPAGHERAGEALRKVCFIGQSGTGKTTLLETINTLLAAERYTYASLENLETLISLEGISKNGQKGGVSVAINKTNQEKKNYYTYDGIWSDYDEDHARKMLLYFTAGFIFHLNSEIELKEHEVKEIFALTEEKVYENTLGDRKLKYNFSRDKISEIWRNILSQASNYMVEELKYSQNLAKTLVKKPEQAQKLIAEFQNWKQTAYNPFEKIAKILNPLLERFNVEVKTDFDFEKIEDLYFIQIQQKEGNRLPLSGWSSGTKQLALTTAPLIALNTEAAIILFDEPENSLYPDIQRILIDYYTQIAPEAQFFFATHSPLIASQFEPWEVVELGFDENGKVQRRNYYEGENHVDNYTIFPQYLRWDSILTHSFGVSYNGNDDFRGELLPKTLRLKKQLAQMEKEKKQDTDEYRQKMETFIKNAKKLGWTEELRTFYEEDK